MNRAPRQKQALDGIRVCDFSWVGAGPRATKELADHGAEVIKIESRHRLDPSRKTPPFVNGDSPDHSAFFVMSNTSKKSVSINLSDPRGQEIARKIAMQSHMVVENFGTGFMERIGLGWDSLHALKPDLVMVSVSIAGRTGPLANFRGFGNSAAATSGQAVMTGFPGHEPHLTNYAYGDVATPLFAAIAMMGALEYQRRTGQGLHVDACQLESMMQLLSPAFLAEAAGISQSPQGNREPWCAPNGVFPCAGDDEWIAISVQSDQDWAVFCELAGIEATEWSESSARLADPGRVEAMVEEWTRRHPAKMAAQFLLDRGIAAGPVQNGQEVSEDPQLLHRQIAPVLTHPDMGQVKHVAPAFALNKTPSNVTLAPRLGADTDHILTSLIGMTQPEIETLKSQQVLA